MPIVANSFADPILTDISIKYANPAAAFVAEQLFPTVQVDKRTGFYFTYDKSNLRNVDSLRTGKSRSNEIDYGLSKTPYGPLLEHSLSAFIENDLLSQADDPLDPRTDATETVTERMLLEKEIDLATTMSDTAIVTQNTTLAGTDQWSDFDNSDPFDDISTAVAEVKSNSLIAPNTLVLSWSVWNKLRNHPDLIDRVKYSDLGRLTTENLQELFDVQSVVIAGASYNNSDEGAADSLDFVFGKHAWLMYISRTPAIRTVTAGYHLQLTNGRVADNWTRDDGKGEYVQVTDYYEAKLVSADSIYLIKNAVA